MKNASVFTALLCFAPIAKVYVPSPIYYTSNVVLSLFIYVEI